MGEPEEGVETADQADGAGESAEEVVQEEELTSPEAVESDVDDVDTEEVAEDE